MSNSLGSIYATTKTNQPNGLQKYIMLDSQNVEVSGNFFINGTNSRMPAEIENSLKDYLPLTYGITDPNSSTLFEKFEDLSLNLLTSNHDASFNNVDVSGDLSVNGNVTATGNLTGNNLNIDNITQTAGSIISSQGTTLEFTLNGQTSGGQGMFFIHAPSLKGLMPNTSQGNGVFSFGSSSRRWGQIYSNYSTISTSDDRMKINERPITNALNFLENLNFYEYEKVGTLNGTDVTETERGVLAQDILNTDLSYCVFGGGIDEETGDEIPYGLRYNDLIMTACQALKDQTTIIKNLEKRIATLESQ